MKKYRIGFPVKFKKAKYPIKKKLVGKYCVLEPVNVKKHAKDLYENFSIDEKGIDWIYMPTGPYKSFSSFKKYLTTEKNWKEDLSFTLVTFVTTKLLLPFCSVR